MLSFDKSASSKTSILCSKPERIARVHATLANTVEDELQICARRVFKNEPIQHENTYDEIKESQFPNLQKYYTFLEKQPDYYYNSEEVFADDLKPVTEFTPKYEEIIGEFTVDESNAKNRIGVNLYKYSIFKNSPEPENIDILNPNCNITNGEEWLSTPVKKYYSEDEISEDCSYFGKRGIVDIFYKSDYLSAKTKVSLFFNVDEQNFDRKLKSSANYTNVLPLGVNFSVLQNDPNATYWCITLNGFIHKEEDVEWADFITENVEDYCKHSLYRNRKLPCVLIPYIPLQSDVLKVRNTDYYIPKDMNMMVKYTYKDSSNPEIITSTVELVPSPINEMKYLRYFVLDLKDSINVSISVYGVGKTQTIYLNNSFSPGGDKLILKDLETDVNIPREKMVTQNIDDLLECYFPHPMFKDANKMRQFFKSILSTNDALDNILTRSGHFVDDTVNYKTCYITNLLSLLTSLNEDVSSYEFGDFGGVYELRDFARLLSMNYSDLVGNIYSKDYDLYVDDTYKGSNLGFKIKIDKKLTIDTTTGAVLFETDKGIENYQLVVIDDHTKDARIVNLSSYCIHEWENIKDKETVEIEIGKDYKKFWGWNLLLPEQYQHYIENDSEIEYLDELEEKRRIIDNHYTFYLFDEYTDKKFLNNFIRDVDITNYGTRTENEFHELWFDKWGIPYDSIYKIINQSLSLSRVGESEYDTDGQDSFFNDAPCTVSFSMKFTQMTEVHILNDIISKYIYCSDEQTTKNALLNDLKNNFNNKLKIEWGDGTKLNKTVPNLVENDYKHTFEKGEYLITVSMSEDMWVDVATTQVTNNGVEIDGDKIRHISTYYGLIAKSQNEDGSISNYVFLPPRINGTVCQHEEPEPPVPEDEKFPLTVYTLVIK